MADERMKSTEEGIAPAPESEKGRAAEADRRRELREGAPADSAMGGTSDADAPADESHVSAVRQGEENPEMEKNLRKR